MSKWHIERFQTLGKYFGYPDCCIRQFLNDSINGTYNEPDRNIEGNYSGFVPCRKCKAKIEAGETTLAGLIKNRAHPQPFPQDHPFEDSYELYRKEAGSVNEKDFNDITIVQGGSSRGKNFKLRQYGKTKPA